jgi:hypothetical protein
LRIKSRANPRQIRSERKSSTHTFDLNQIYKLNHPFYSFYSLIVNGIDRIYDKFYH